MLLKSTTFALMTTLVTAAPSFINNGTGSGSKHHEHKNHKRGTSAGTCAFPNYDGMVAVQTSGGNAGWAMHYDQECTPGTWCPYACKPGQLMGQWDQDVTTYSYPGSQYGGLYCQEDGTLKTPNPNNDYCYDGKGTVSAVNSCGGGDVAFCQTVLPGNEEMLIPTLVSDEEVLAVPGTEYWAGTASHFYINPPGVSVNDGCKWGDNSKPQGNWAPYVAGANMDDSGNTYVKIGWNPIYLEEATPFRNEKPSFGIRITCDDESQCEGLPCAIDPSIAGVNGISSGQTTEGAGGATFCVVTAKNNAKAKIEVFEAGSSDGSAQKRDVILSKDNITSTTTTLSSNVTQQHAHRMTTVTEIQYRTVTSLV